MLDLVLAILASYVQSALEWCGGVAPWVGLFALVAFGLAVFAAVMMQARHRQMQRKWAESIRPGKGFGI